ncbi:MAG: acetolactate synthase large subunit, partial [Pseudonocardia sp.]|nr:acetolactate synthase large subunit [Pseudonocardia sp.]
MPTGAQALLRTLVAGGVEVCFANPGTSEMHAVAALDEVPGIRGILTLFEGVAAGAADGYARMAGRPAATLLHLGPGLGNAVANLHNARRAGVGVVNVVGDHAVGHARYDAPLQSDIDSLAAPVSGWVGRVAAAADVAADTAAAVAAARAGQVATLILPADASWSDGAADEPVPVPQATPREPGSPAALQAAAAALRSGEPCLLLLGGDATRADGLAAAGAITAATGARMLVETFPARLERGAGVVAADRLAYLPDVAAHQLGGIRHLVLAGARSPVTFFGYPGRRGDLVPEGCHVYPVAGPKQAAAAALAALADEVAPGVAARPAAATRPALPSGPLTAQT